MISLIDCEERSKQQGWIKVKRIYVYTSIAFMLSTSSLFVVVADVVVEANR